MPQQTTATVRLAELPAAAAPYRQGAELATRANDILLRTMRGLVQGQTELMQLQTQQLLQTFAGVKAGDDPRVAVPAYCAHCHDGAEKVLSKMRAMNDEVRQAGWELFSLCTEGLLLARPPSAGGV